MSRFTNNPAIYNQAIGLSEKDKQDPIGGIKDFFTKYPLSDVRDIQDQIQRVCLIAEKGIFSRPDGRTKLMDYLEQLIFLFEAAFQLSQSFSAAFKSEMPVGRSEEELSPKHYDPHVMDLVNGINGAVVDVAQLCVIVVNAWGDKMDEYFKLPPSSSKNLVRSTRLAWVDLNNLQSMALALQNKMAKLSGMAIDMMIAEKKLTI